MRKFLVLMVFGVLSVQPNLQAQTLGRLFTTPAERAELDQLRKRGGVDPVLDQPKSEPTVALPGSDLSTLNGFVARSSGKTTTWINQTPHHENDNNKTVLVEQQPHHPPVIYLQTESGKRVRVKVGETLDMKSGTIRSITAPPSQEATPGAGNPP